MSSLRVPGKPSGGQGLPHGGVVLESVSAASGGPLLGGCIFSPAPAPPLVTACLVHPATDPQVVLRDPQVVPQPRFASVFPAPLALPSPSAPSQMRPTPTAPPPRGHAVPGTQGQLHRRGKGSGRAGTLCLLCLLGWCRTGSRGPQPSCSQMEPPTAQH